LQAERAERWSITAIGPGDTAFFTIDEFTSDGVPRIVQRSGFSWTNERVFQILVDELIYKKGFNPFPGFGPFAIHLDSSAFFRNGKKLGLGSSAALVVALAKFFSLFAAGEEGPFPPWEFDDFCLDVHRKLQGGKGSGYDILTSIHGGCVFIQGGDREAFRCKDKDKAALEYAITETWRKGVYYSGLIKLDGVLLCAANEVRTSSAIDAYNHLKIIKPCNAQRFYRRSKRLVRKTERLFRSIKQKQFALSTSQNKEAFARFLGILHEGGRLGEAFGDALGVSARFPYPAEGFIKCLGAGNEMAFATLSSDALDDRITVLPFIITEGMKVEET
jgi:phosphomevalonate kinase